MTERIQGRVIASGGRPVPGASVIIASGPGSVPDIAAETNEHGEFALSGLHPGTYILRASTPDGRQGEALARLPSANRLEIQVGIDEWSTSEEDGSTLDDGEEDNGEEQ
jgi:hypothetical protein